MTFLKLRFSLLCFTIKQSTAVAENKSFDGILLFRGLSGEVSMGGW